MKKYFTLHSLSFDKLDKDRIKYNAIIDFHISQDIKLSYTIEYYSSPKYGIRPEMDIEFPDPYIDDPDREIGLEMCNKEVMDLCINQLGMDYQEGNFPICWVDLKHEWIEEDFQQFIEDFVEVLNEGMM